jgi:hypothetical protein
MDLFLFIDYAKTIKAIVNDNFQECPSFQVVEKPHFCNNFMFSSRLLQTIVQNKDHSNRHMLGVESVGEYCNSFWSEKMGGISRSYHGALQHHPLWCPLESTFLTVSSCIYGNLIIYSRTSSLLFAIIATPKITNWARMAEKNYLRIK